MKKITLTFLIIFMCSCDLVFVENISDKNINVIAPSDNSELAAGKINFFWETLEDADEYKIQIVTPDFNNATEIVVDSTLSTTSFTKELVAGDYQWRLKAMNTEYETAYEIYTLKIN